MTTTFRAHYDGKVIVPDEPVDLPVGEPLDLNLGRALSGRAQPGMSPEEQIRRIRATSGRIRGISLPDEALRRENMYEERL